MSWRSFSYYNIATCTNCSNSIRIKKLTIPESKIGSLLNAVVEQLNETQEIILNRELPFPTFSELKLESSFLVKNLNSMIIGVSNNDVILCIYCNAGWFCKLAFEHPELAKLQTRENIELQTKVKMQSQYGQPLPSSILITHLPCSGRSFSDA